MRANLTGPQQRKGASDRISDARPKLQTGSARRLLVRWTVAGRPASEPLYCWVTKIERRLRSAREIERERQLASSPSRFGPHLSFPFWLSPIQNGNLGVPLRLRILPSLIARAPSERSPNCIHDSSSH
jgi:hypothetical protein